MSASKRYAKLKLINYFIILMCKSDQLPQGSLFYLNRPLTCGKTTTDNCKHS